MPLATRRVLIVDDEPRVTESLAASLSRIGEAYVVETAHSGGEALAKIQQTPYALVVTDYMMPEMDGLELARAVRRVSPDTQVVLMTAYGGAGLRDTAGQELDGYLDKPFTVAQVREVVKRAIGQTSKKDPYHSGERALEHSVHEQLATLQVDTGARCVVLLSSSGYPVETAGTTDGFDVTSVGALVAANFAAAAELARLLGKGSVFKSSYHEGHEGTDHNIYAYDVNGAFLLAVVFGAESKPGIVWFYTKQVAAALVPLVAEYTVTATPARDPNLTPLGAEPASGSENGNADHDQVMSLQEAVAAGLLPAEFGAPADSSFGQSVSDQLDSFLGD